MSLPGNVVVDAAPFNGPDDSDAACQWVNLNQWVMTASGAQIPTSSFGRQTDLQSVDPGQFTITLNNADHRFTPGNPASPYYPGWRTGMRLRMRETVGARTFILADGNLLQPSATVQVPGRIQQVTVTAQDRIGRLQQGRKFISTLAEYIQFNGGTALRGYWPCTESSPLFRDVTGNGNNPIQQIGVGASSVAVTSGAPLVLAGQGSPVLNDDAATAVLQASLGVSGGNNALAVVPDVRTFWSSPLPSIPSGQYVTAVMWINGNPPATPFDLTAFGLTLDTSNQHILTTFDAGGRMGITVTGTMTGTSSANFPITGWTSIGVRYSWSVPSLEIWVGTSRYPVTLSGGPPASDSVLDLLLPETPCAFGHVQLYIGTAADWDMPQMAAQIQAARSCLSGQYTGQRIATAAQYAGIAAGELSDVDVGVSQMGRARLAGRTALDVMREAETAEQGLLHAYGRHPVFHDRARRYNR